MTKEGIFVVFGEVTETLPNTLFRVEILNADEDHKNLVGKIILCHLSGKMRRYYIKVMPGDRVKIEMTPYDLGKGRIVYREK
jgi:translation initiation factor IF-1